MTTDIEYEQWLAEQNADDDHERLEAEKELLPLWQLQEAKRMYDKAVKELDPSASNYAEMGKVRRWLTDHEGEVLYDNVTESGVSARLRSGGSYKVYDVEAIRDDAPQLMAQLVRIGVLKIDSALLTAAAKANKIALSDLEKYCHPIERTRSLIVEKEQR